MDDKAIFNVEIPLNSCDICRNVDICRYSDARENIINNIRGAFLEHHLLNEGESEVFVIEIRCKHYFPKNVVVGPVVTPLCNTVLQRPGYTQNSFSYGETCNPVIYK